MPNFAPVLIPAPFLLLLLICRLSGTAANPCNTQTSCETCLSNTSCLWCLTNSACTDYPVSHILPPASVCQLSQARWGVCWVNFEALIIAMAVLGAVLLIGIAVCCCCCCGCCGCCGCSGCCGHRRSSRLDEEAEIRRRDERKQQSDERRAERRMRNDEIRKKYGLIADSEHPYSRFENE